MNDRQSFSDDESYGTLRHQMIQRQIVRRGITNKPVLRAMHRVPRHKYVADELRARAYDDGPLPIGARQTISQPYIVALMTQLIEPMSTDRVLEIGVGSGYQTAVLAELVAEVVGIERIPELGDRARSILIEQGYTNISIHIQDGTQGFPARAPYHCILVAAAAPKIPQPLLEQLAEGGRLVIPVGNDIEQMIHLAIRKGNKFDIKKVIPVRFVPLIGVDGFAEKPRR